MKWFFSRVAVTRRPVKSEYGKDEKLIPGGQPIITYRRIREALKTSASLSKNQDTCS